MSKLLKSKYNSTGDRCVDSFLSYGNLKYLDNKGEPINIEVPFDKYEDIINDFEERKKENLINQNIQPENFLKRGDFTYNQVKNIAKLNKIKELKLYDIDGSIEIEHVLGISGVVEYALAIWNGDSEEVALEKAIIKAIKVHGVKFVNSLSLDKDYNNLYDKLFEIANYTDLKLYTTNSCKIHDEIYKNIVDFKVSSKKKHDIILGAIGSLVGVMMLEWLTNFGSLFNNMFVHIGVIIAIMVLSYIFSIKITKLISYEYIKKTNGHIIDMFNNELEYYTFNNLITEEENDIIAQSITKGDISKLIIEMQGSVNKKISINKFISKKTEIILASRRSIFLPDDNDIKEMTESIINKILQ